jgi:Tfp pilus assembly protein PilZ
MSRRNERKFRRIEVSLNARWSGDGGNNEAHIINLGLGGCFVTGSSHIPVGEETYLDVQMVDGNWLSLPIKTVYALFDRGIGVKFGYLSREQSEAVTRTIDYYIETTEGSKQY